MWYSDNKRSSRKVNVQKNRRKRKYIYDTVLQINLTPGGPYFTPMLFKGQVCFVLLFICNLNEVGVAKVVLNNISFITHQC